MIRDPNHHAHLVIGDWEALRTDIHKSIETTMGVSTVGNPDFYEERIEVFGIDEGRRIKEIQSRASFGKGSHVTLISFDSITTEAQNALLKITEEPPRGAKMIFVTRDTSRLLPTFMSRFSINETVYTPNVSLEGALFFALNPGERLKHIEKIVKDKDREKAKKVIEDCLHEVRRRDISTPENAKRLKILGEALSFVGDRSSSIKMILEWVSLTL